MSQHFFLKIILSLTLFGCFSLASRGEAQLFERVSISTSGTEANGASYSSALSGDGRYVVFVSNASNLTPNDKNGVADIFVRDRVTAITERISVSQDGSDANGTSALPQLSADGRYVVFASNATNLISNDTNSTSDIFVRDRLWGVTERISQEANGTQLDRRCDWPSISADGRFVAYHASPKQDLSETPDWIIVYDRLTRSNVQTISSYIDPWNFAHLSRNGKKVVANRFTWGNISVYGRDDSSTDYTCADFPDINRPLPQSASLSYDGSAVSYAIIPNRYQGYSHICFNNTTLRISIDNSFGNNDSWDSQISPDGKFVFFSSSARNLVPADFNDSADIFVYSLERQTTTRLAGAGGHSSQPAVSDNGSMLAFTSEAPDIVAGDHNGFKDVFVRPFSPAHSFAPRIAWHNPQTGDVTFWQTEWLKWSFSAPLATGVPADWRIGATLDLNDDGYLDFVWHNAVSGQVAYWLMKDGTRLAYGLIAQNIPGVWRLETAADVTLDGDPELIWRNTQSGDVTYWMLEGTRWTRSGTIYRGVPNEWKLEGAPDLNHDGIAELLWRNTKTGDVYSWNMEGDDLISSDCIATNVPLDWQIVATPDMNQDGTSDFLWYNRRTGDVSYWLMFGTRTGTTGLLARNIPLTWRPEASY